MRVAFAVVSLTGLVAAAQEKAKGPEMIPVRYGVEYRAKAYPQGTPKQALEALLAAADKGEYAYLAAHLLEPGFVDGRVTERAKQFAPAIEVNLAKQRDAQRRAAEPPTAADKLPDDAPGFAARVTADAKTAAFKQFVRDMQDRLADDPEVLKDLRKFVRQGTFPADAGGEAAAVTLPGVRDRAVYLKRAGDRWYVENRQTEEKGEGGKKE